MTIDYTEIGKRIARRRKALGLKQSEVEEKAGLGQKYLSNIERSISHSLYRSHHEISLCLKHNSR